MKKILLIFLILGLVFGQANAISLIGSGVAPAGGGDDCVSDAIALGASYDDLNSDYQPTQGAGIESFTYVALCDGPVDQVCVQVAATYQYGSTTATIGIYSDNAGEPDTLLGDTAAISYGSGLLQNYTVCGTLDSPVTLVKGTTYHIAIAQSGADYFYIDGVLDEATPTGHYNTTQVYSAGSLPGTFPTVSGTRTGIRVGFYANAQ